MDIGVGGLRTRNLHLPGLHAHTPRGRDRTICCPFRPAGDLIDLTAYYHTTTHRITHLPPHCPPYHTHIHTIVCYAVTFPFPRTHTASTHFTPHVTGSLSLVDLISVERDWCPVSRQTDERSRVGGVWGYAHISHTRRTSL